MKRTILELTLFAMTLDRLSAKGKFSKSHCQAYQKTERRTINMKTNFLLTGLILIGLLGMAVVSPAFGDNWEQKARMLNPKWTTAVAVVDGKIYTVGGTNDQPGLSTVEAYDPAADKWTVKAPMPTPRLRHAVCVVNGKIYAIGGTPHNGGNDVLAAVEEYDPATDTWTKKAKMPTARHLLSLSVVDGKIYAIGGGKGSIPLGALRDLDPGPVEVYDPATNTWVKKPNMPAPRRSHGAGVIRGKIYLVGGSGGGRWISAVSEYDPATGRWEEKADIPTKRTTLAVSVVNNKIYAIGGGGPNWAAGEIFSIVEEYDPATDTWTKKTAMPSRGTDVSSGVVNGRIYVIGGWPGGGIREWVEEYTPEGWPFPSAVSPQGKLVTTWGTIRQEK